MLAVISSNNSQTWELSCKQILLYFTMVNTEQRVNQCVCHGDNQQNSSPLRTDIVQPDTIMLTIPQCWQCWQYRTNNKYLWQLDWINYNDMIWRWEQQLCLSPRCLLTLPVLPSVVLSSYNTDQYSEDRSIIIEILEQTAMKYRSAVSYYTMSLPLCQHTTQYDHFSYHLSSRQAGSVLVGRNIPWQI